MITFENKTNEAKDFYVNNIKINERFFKPLKRINFLSRKPLEKIEKALMNKLVQLYDNQYDQTKFKFDDTPIHDFSKFGSQDFKLSGGDKHDFRLLFIELKDCEDKDYGNGLANAELLEANNFYIHSFKKDTAHHSLFQLLHLPHYIFMSEYKSLDLAALDKLREKESLEELEGYYEKLELIFRRYIKKVEQEIANLGVISEEFGIPLGVIDHTTVGEKINDFFWNYSIHERLYDIVVFKCLCLCISVFLYLFIANLPKLVLKKKVEKSRK